METTRTITDPITVPDHTPKIVGDHLHEHRAAITAQAHTLRDLATVKAQVRTLIDPTILKEKVRPKMIRVSPMEKVKVVKVKDAGGNAMDTQPQRLPTLINPKLRQYPMENNQLRNGNQKMSMSKAYNGKTLHYANDYRHHYIVPTPTVTADADYHT